MPRKNKEDYREELRKSYERWKYIYENGCSDPAWPDGVNLNLVRNHIIYYKTLIEESTPPSMYFTLPDEYFYPEPPKVNTYLMCNDRECRFSAFSHSEFKSRVEFPSIPYRDILSNEFKRRFYDANKIWL